VTCYATEDAFQIVSWFNYNLISVTKLLITLLLIYTDTRQSLQFIRSSFRLFNLTVT
jgi:hypothetical protein